MVSVAPVFVFIVLAVSVSVARSTGLGSPLHAGCHSPPPYSKYLGTPNDYPILNVTDSRKLVKEVSNGRLYIVSTNVAGVSAHGNIDAGDIAPPGFFYVAHVWGSPYDWGRAQGELYGSSASDFYDSMWKYMQAQVDSAIPHFPKFLRDLIDTYGLEAALGLTYEATKGYTDPHVYEEMKGLAEGSGASFDRIMYMHMIAGLTQGKCSMFGAWGDAVLADAGVLQLRALDWDMDAPVRNFSAVTVYHPSGPSAVGHAHVTVGFTGFAGALTGMSEKQLGISEIGVSFPDPSFGKESRVGKPFIFVLREILMYDNTIDDSISRLATTKRTCDLILGVGDGKLGEFRSFEYSSTQLHVIDDENLIPANDTWHPKIKNIVYHGMDWDCPSFNWMLHRQLQSNYGKITPEVAINDVSAVQTSGDNHIAYYSLKEMSMYVSFSAPLGVSGKVAAYQRQYARFDMAKEFAEKL